MSIAIIAANVCAADPVMREIVWSVSDEASLRDAAAVLGVKYPDAVVEAELLEMASSDPRFARSKDAREWLVKIILRTPLSAETRVQFSAPVEQFLIAELQSGSKKSQSEIFGFTSIRKFTPDRHGDLRQAAWTKLSSDDYAVIIGSLRVLSMVGVPNPQAARVLRSLVIDPERSVHPDVVLERSRYAPLDAWYSIRYGAASAMLKCSIIPTEDVAWLGGLEGDAAFVARDVLLLNVAPDRMIDFAEPIVQRELVNALVQVMRSTIDRRQISQDELAVFVSVGERFPQFRQDIGDLFEQMLTDPRYAHHHEAMKRILDRWSKP